MECYFKSSRAITRNKTAQVAVLLVVVVITLAFLVGCMGSPQYKKVSLKDGSQDVAATPFQPNKTALRVAIAGVISPKETIRIYDPMLDYLGKKLDRPVQLVQRSTYAEINDLLRSGGVDLAFVCGGAYIEGRKDFGMELLVVPVVRGEAVYHSFIIVPTDSTVRQVEDLKGKTFAFTDPLSNSGRLAPIYMLLEKGETPESFFKKYVFTYSHDNSIRAVAQKLVDAAAVDSLVYQYNEAHNPQYTAQTRIIWISPPYGSPPVVVHPGLNGQFKQQLRDVLLRMSDEEEGKVILKDLQIDQFVVEDDRAYESIREMYTKVRLQSGAE